LQTLSGGSFTFSIPANSLSNGTDTLILSYFGDANYISGTGTATVTVGQSTFTLNNPVVAVNPTSVNAGTSSSATVTMAAVGGYTGTVTLSCAQTSTTATGGDGATCTGGGTLSPVTLSSTTTSGTVKFTIGTTAKIGALAYPKVLNNDKGWLSGGAVLAFLVFLGIPARRRAWRQMLGMLILIAALAGLSSCGGGSVNSGGGGNTDPGTTSGTYTFTVQATGSPTVTPAVTTTFTVTVN
jgi:hypothetical protein